MLLRGGGAAFDLFRHSMRGVGKEDDDRTLHQLARYLQFRAEVGIVVATFEVMRRRIRLDLQWIVHPLGGPQAADADHPVFSLADVSQPLSTHMSGMLAPL